jgi:hypothetical protein
MFVVRRERMTKQRLSNIFVVRFIEKRTAGRTTVICTVKNICRAPYVVMHDK